MARKHGHQRHLAGMNEPQRRRQHGFEPDGAVGRLGEGLALDLEILRIVVGMDDVDHAVPQPGDDRLPVVLGAQAAGRA